MRPSRLVVLLAAGAAAGCSTPMVFQGQSALAISGTPPAAPPPPPRVEVRENKIEIHEKIQFDYDKATIKPESFSLMNEIAQVITKNPQIKKIRIEGYASSEGGAEHNKKLSDARAKSVMKWLGEHGIAEAMLSAIGYGVEHPIADNSTEEGREKNRRVEFTILEQDVTKKKVQIDAKTGAEKVLEEQHETVKAPDADTPTPTTPASDGKPADAAKPAKTTKSSKAHSSAKDHP